MKNTANNRCVGGFLMALSLLCSTVSASPARDISIIPLPVRMTTGKGQFVLSPDTRIICNQAALQKARQLAHILTQATGFDITTDTNGPKTNAIILKIESKPRPSRPEGYTINVSRDDVELKASDQAGIFYACRTLLQLFPEDIYRRKPANGLTWSLPCVTIEDYPRFPWRGALLDTARHFMPVEFIKKLIDTLAMHKMNSLHLHLTDDQGWRIEIKKYPKLTEIGAWRDETLIGHYNHRPRKYDGKRHGGFYTQDDIREIVAHAKQRHINIVPEIEMPGHAQAAIAAYPHLGNTGQKLPVRTIWGVNPNILNANESTILFFQDVLTEVMELFPSKFIHIGGDEAPKQQWKAGADAQKRIKELGLKDEHELQSYFIKRMDTFLASHGRRLIGWDEILEGGLAPGATVMSWRGENGGIVAAKAGHDVVMAPTTYTYFDYYQSRDKTEPLAIGGYLPLKTVYNYNPVPAQLSKKQARHVLGTQGQLWTEYIPTPAKAEYMAFPRLTALAEVAWTPAKNKDYDDFTKRLKTHLARLDVRNVKYRPLDPSPVADWKSGQTTEDWSIEQYDLTEHIKKAGTYAVTFHYTHGVHRLDIACVELAAGGKTIARDEHPGTTGARSKDNTYELTVPRYDPAASYLLRAKLRSDGGTNSNGEIYLKKARPSP